MARGSNAFSASRPKEVADRLAQSAYRGYIDKRLKGPFGFALDVNFCCAQLANLNLAVRVFNHLFFLGDAQCEHTVFVACANAFTIYGVGQGKAAAKVLVAELFAVVTRLGFVLVGFLVGRNVQLVVLELNVEVGFFEAGGSYLHVKTGFGFLNVDCGCGKRAGVGKLVRIAAKEVFQKAVEWSSVAGRKFSQCHLV